jgi:DNA-binding MarR family transcriptional regulator
MKDQTRLTGEYTAVLADVFAEVINKAAYNPSEFERHGVTKSLLNCLNYIFLHGSSSIRHIASGMDITLPAASQLVDRLVKKNLANRCEDETDRRIALVSLSDAGLKIVKSYRKSKTAWFESVLGGFSEKTKAHFIEGLESFLANAVKSDDIAKTCDRCGNTHIPSCIINKLKNN